MPTGDHCVYASQEIDGTTYIFGVCSISVGAGQIANIGTEILADESVYSCSGDSDCSTRYALPEFSCTTDLGTSSCSGFTCAGENEETGESFCVLSQSATATDICSSNDSSFEISGSCNNATSACDSPDDFSWVRAAPNRICENTTRCSSNTDCPAGSVCFIDGYCFSNGGLAETGLETCNLTEGCTNTCLPVQGSSSCTAYCFDEDLFNLQSCNTDADCDEIGGGTCYETVVPDTDNTGSASDEENGEAEFSSDNLIHIRRCIKNDVTSCSDGL